MKPCLFLFQLRPPTHAQRTQLFLAIIAASVCMCGLQVSSASHFQNVNGALNRVFTLLDESIDHVDTEVCLHLWCYQCQWCHYWCHFCHSCQWCYDVNSVSGVSDVMLLVSLH